jgi:glycosyltransferase involved in cell wall biosynthesis
MRVLIIGGISKSLINFRGPLIRDTLARGHEITACAGEPCEEVVTTLASWGVTFMPVNLGRAGMNPLADIRTFLQLRRIMCDQRPDIVLSYTIKPVIWGGFAARLTGAYGIFSLITGLGHAFMKPRNIRHHLVAITAKLLYKFSLRHSQKVFFQNPDDSCEFITKRLVQERQSIIVNGSGVDTKYFAPFPLKASTTFLFIGRLLVDKGVREYVSAVRALCYEGNPCKALLVGKRDPNPASISQVELDEWKTEGAIDYWGSMNDVRPAFAQCSVYVLPSYREGTPRTVLEAMSMGRPIITTDAPGCRETVPLTTKGKQQKEHGRSVMEGENGFLVQVRNAGALAQAMNQFIQNPELIAKMGKRSREIAEEKYDVHKVNKVLLDTMGL